MRNKYHIHLKHILKGKKKYLDNVSYKIKLNLKKIFLMNKYLNKEVNDRDKSDW